MPSEEHQKIVEFLRAMPDDSKLSYPQIRAGLNARSETLTVAEGVNIEPTTINGIDAAWFTPKQLDTEMVLYYLHGGGYCVGSYQSHQSLISILADSLNCKCLAINYRLAPENPFPAAVKDASAGYEWLITSVSSPTKIVFAGDSAGGGLALASMHDLKMRGLPLPASSFVISPWCDLTCSGESYQSKIKEDPMLKFDRIVDMAKVYVGKANKRSPIINPLNGNFTGFPPLLIHAGTAELLLDDSLALEKKARSEGVEVEMEIWDEMIHAFHYYAAMLPEAKEAIKKITDFVNKHMERHLYFKL